MTKTTKTPVECAGARRGGCVMITQIATPDVALRCDGCGEVWYFTADEPLHESERDEFIEDCLEDRKSTRLNSSH